MKPAAFEYLAAKTLDEALSALASGGDAKVIAGGQSLVPMMNFRLVQPEFLVDINSIPELSDIEERDGGLKLGALVRHAQSLKSPEALRHFPIIAETLQHVAHVAIRNRGTIGGSLVHADPAAEWPLLVTLLDAELEIHGPDGLRRVAPDEFFIAPLVTGLEDGEILTAVHLPYLPAGTGTAFEEVSQRAGDFAIASAGAIIALKDGIVAEARLALGGVADTAIRARAAEEHLLGKTLTTELMARASQFAAEGLEPNADLHASSEYRLHLIPIVARRVLERASRRAEGGIS
ncbi:xanthine dehydrogenase family protein subunit M (plasmid) [Aminobacter sp. SR38]|jgi:carbon-monoxide dehydrogenase medium subunit|uniref:FAD binding domain-containing protein n=1 Tax=Aminobacter sp. SR38 TaxID=2774562 RepID=UPI00177F95F8|nr:xanthine dehydrogenase family protein subunit M [Aminobacter sp. SR38]QOF75555.1 xanthine dehydrogenase family protein subunit M [Aminobacter sp. SR38]